MPMDEGNVKEEPACDFIENALVKEEADYVTEETEWEDSALFLGVSEAAAQADLYPGHEVKDELVLGPEVLQATAIFAVHAAPASDAREHPGLRSCAVRLERIHDLEALFAAADTRSHDTCRATDTLDTCRATEEDEDSRGDADAAPASDARGHPGLRSCAVRLERIHDLEALFAAKDTRSHDTCRDTDTLDTCRATDTRTHDTCRATDEDEDSRGDADELSLSDRDAFELRECFVALERCDAHATHATHATHADTHAYECDACGLTFRHKLILIQHILLHARSAAGEDLFTCDICDRQFASRQGMLYHLKTHSGRKGFACGTCGRRFTCAASLARHATTHDANRRKTVSCQICSKPYFNKIDVNRHVLRVHLSEKTHLCKICKKRFSCVSHLYRHMKTHTGERPYECDTCHAKFGQKSSLKLHERVHTGERPYACGMCKRRFANSSGLNRHQVTHAAKTYYSCETCKKRFTKLSVLMRHYKVHMKYACKVCGKEFRRRDYLETHELIHSGVKPFTCDVCSKGFTQFGHLNLHKLIHSGKKPHLCVICKKSFRDRGNLAKHKQTHSDERPFVCECKKRFRDLLALNSHRRVHTGEKPFPCGVCGRKFAHRSTLWAHKKSHE